MTDTPSTLLQELLQLQTLLDDDAIRPDNIPLLDRVVTEQEQPVTHELLLNDLVQCVQDVYGNANPHQEQQLRQRLAQVLTLHLGLPNLPSPP